jgi:hypothetical protein
MSIEPPFSNVSAQRRKFGKRVGDDLNTRYLEIDHYFGVVTWLALFGTVVAGTLVITSSEIPDAIWLFNQVP